MVGEIDTSAFDALVIAAGAWSCSIVLTAKGSPLPIPKTIPVKGYRIGYDLPRGAIPHILLHGHTYVLQRANGYTIAGSTEERVGFNRTVDPNTCGAIQAPMTAERRASSIAERSPASAAG